MKPIESSHDKSERGIIVGDSHDSKLPIGPEVAEIELYYKTKITKSKQFRISGSSDAATLLKKYWSPEKIQFVEEFKVLLLNRANLATGLITVSSGTSTSAIVDMKLIFIAAIKSNASGIILAHNHPSGNLNPSESDKALTTRAKNSGKILEIQVLDHIIITTDGYYSFADQGNF
jgi:DNA repair protein RadC